jgi:hypothetical protein
MRLPGQSNKPGNPDSQIIPEMALFASIISRVYLGNPRLLEGILYYL